MGVCGCGAQVAEENGPRHRYMVAEAGCWRRFGELQARLPACGPSNPLAVDAYASQHPTNEERDPRQRQSVAVHLIALRLHVERGMPLERLQRLRAQISARVLPRLGAAGWPALTPPTSWGPLNAPGIAELPDGELDAAVREWAEQVWRSWAEHHDVVDRWASLLTGEAT